MVKRSLILTVAAVLLIGVAFAGAASAYSGTGTASDPYLVETLEDLQQMANEVNSGTSYSGQYFKLTNNIVIPQGTEFSIGNSTSNPFAGHFDGDNHKISYVITQTYRDDAPAFVGNTLFGYVFGNDATNKASISNLNVGVTVSFGTDKTFNKKDMFAGVIIATKNAEIKNIVTDAATWDLLNVKSVGERLYLGGISVYDYGGSIYDGCVNHISVNAKNYINPGDPNSGGWNHYITFGGISGRTEIPVGAFTVYINCNNTGSFYQANPYDIDMTGIEGTYYAQRTVYGGIIGQINNASILHQVLVLDCENTGTARGGGNNYWNGSQWLNGDSTTAPHGSRGYFVGERWVSAGENGYQKYGVEGTADWVADFKDTICWGQKYYVETTPIVVSRLTEETLAAKYPPVGATYSQGLDGPNKNCFMYNDSVSRIPVNDSITQHEHFTTISGLVSQVGTFGSNEYPNGATVIFGKVASPVAKIGDTKYATLKDAVDAVKSGETIELLTDVALDSSVSCEGSVKNCFTIDGHGYSIKMKNGVNYGEGCFELGTQGGSVTPLINYTLTDIVFKGTDTVQAVNIIRADGCELFIDSCRFENCNVTYGSGFPAVIRGTSANVTITNSIFNDNNCTDTAETNARLIEVNSNDATDGTLSIDNCLFSNNKVTNGDGLIYFSEQCSHTVNIADSTFENNHVTATTEGQAAILYVSYTAEVSGCLFKQNTLNAAGSGNKCGVIAFGGSPAFSIISRNAFVDNIRTHDQGSPTPTVYVASKSNITLTENYWGDGTTKGSAPTVDLDGDVYLTSGTGNVYDSFATGYDSNSFIYGATVKGITTKPVVPEIEPAGPDGKVNVTTDNVKVDGTTAIIAKDAGKTGEANTDVIIKVTNANIAVEQENTTITPTESSVITAEYKITDADMEDIPLTVPYTVTLTMKNISSTVPTLSGEFNASIQSLVDDSYTALTMVTTANTDEELEKINENLKQQGISIVFEVPVSSISDTSKVQVLHVVDDVYSKVDSNIDGPTINDTYKIAITGDSFSAYVVSLAKDTPRPGPYVPSSHREQGQTVIQQETAVPTATPTPGQTDVPTMKPTTKPTQTQKSPVPVAGIIAGLGAAFMLMRMRQ